MKDKIYISGKITGDANYMIHFAEAEESLKNQGYIVVNPAKILSNMPKETTYEEYMELSIKLLSMCNEIFLLCNWWDSAGALREHAFAKFMHIPMTEEREYNDY